MSTNDNKKRVPFWVMVLIGSISCGIIFVHTMNTFGVAMEL